MVAVTTGIAWNITATVSGSTYTLGAMPITRQYRQALAEFDHPWARQLEVGLKRCNSMTFAKRGFDSSIGYLAFDLNQLAGGVSYGDLIQGMCDERSTITFTQRYTNDGTVVEKYLRRLYAHELEVFHTQWGGAVVGVLKLVDNRYTGKILAPMRNSTHSFSGVYSTDPRAMDLFYYGMYGPDWEFAPPVEYPTLREQMYYWMPSFKDWAVTIPAAIPWTLQGIAVNPSCETAYETFRRLVQEPHDGTYVADLQIDAGTGLATVVSNVPLPSPQMGTANNQVSNGYYVYKSPGISSKFEVLFPINRKGIWNTETVNPNFKIRYQSPYTQPTRIPSAAFLAYYPAGVPDGINDCISILSDRVVVPIRQSSKASGPPAGDVFNSDKYDFDYASIATEGDLTVNKYLAMQQAFSFFQSQTLVSFADPYTYGANPDLICGARFLFRDDELSTEIFWGCRFQVRETEGMPYVGPADQIHAESYTPANLLTRQLGEQAFEELQLPYAGWPGHTQMQIFGNSLYTGGDYTLQSSAYCDALIGVGEASIVHSRLDEIVETNTLGTEEGHALVKSRDMITGVNFVGYMMQDGVYRPIDQPSVRVAAVQIRWGSSDIPSSASDATNMHQKFAAPYFGETTPVSGGITNPVSVFSFDRGVFRVFDKQVLNNAIKTALNPADCVNPSLAFITSANRVMLGKTIDAIDDGAIGAVYLYENTTDRIPVGTGGYLAIMAKTPLGRVAANKFVFVCEILETWYIIAARCD